MFFISKETELNEILLAKIMNNFTLKTLPVLRNWHDYYKGNMEILKKSYTDETKPCSHIVTNYCKVIVDTYAGYICGKPVSYFSNDNIEDIQAVINYNDDAAENIDWLTNALIYGVGYELQWLDSDSQIRYSQINPEQAFAIYDNSLDNELLYFVRWYKKDEFDDSDTFILELYAKETTKIYEMHGVGGYLRQVGEKPNFFNDIPVSVFYLNGNEENIFKQVISLNDAYNELCSSEIDDYSAFVDAYLVLSGVDADVEDVVKMKENRALILPEGAAADYLVKKASDSQIENMLENIRKNIFKISNTPDMSDENFLAQSGTALAYKLVGFENAASSIVARFTKALQRRIELICNILKIKGNDNTAWRDINISFVRNIPVNIAETGQLVNNLKGIVSDATLLSQIPFVKDVTAELEAIEKQNKENLSLYNFDM